MPREKLLFDPKTASAAKRVLSSESPDTFRPAFSAAGQEVLALLASGPNYPAEVARKLDLPHQTVYSIVKRLEESGLVSRVGKRKIRGGEAGMFSLSADGYAVEFKVRGEDLPSIPASSRSRTVGRFFSEFVASGSLDGWIVVGSPLPHGAGNTQARDGHYAVQLGFALGQFVKLPKTFPVKLDVDVKAERLERSNLVIVGGPRTNLLAEEANRHLPVRFKPGEFWGSIQDQDGGSYNSETDALVAKVRSPWDPAKTVILAAGLTGAGTKAAVIGITNLAEEVLGRYSSGDFACVLRGLDRDGDGKVDGVEVLKRTAG